MSAGRLGHAIGAGVALITAMCLARPVSAQSLTPLVGRWLLDRGASDDPMRAADSVAAAFSFVTRSMVRAKLRTLARAWPSVTIARSATGALAVWTDGPRVDLPLTDSTVAWQNEEGRTMQAAARVDSVAPTDVREASALDGVLVLRMLAPDGGERRIIVGAVRSVPRTLVVHVRVMAPRMPRPLRYRLVYRLTA